MLYMSFELLHGAVGYRHVFEHTLQLGRKLTTTLRLQQESTESTHFLERKLQWNLYQATTKFCGL